MSAPNQQMTPASDPAKQVVSFKAFNSDEEVKLSQNIVTRYLCRPTRAGKLPDHADVVRFIMVCKARRLNPFIGDAYLVGYDGSGGPEWSIITAHQALLKRAEVHPEYDGMDSGVIVKDAAGNLVDRVGDFTLDDDVLLGAWAVVHFKTRTHRMEKRVRLSVFNKGYSRWKIDPAGMIVKVAEADALRSSFPNELGGLYTHEETGTSSDAQTILIAPPVNGEAQAPAKTRQQAPAAPAAPRTGMSVQLEAEIMQAVEEAGLEEDDVRAAAGRAGLTTHVLSQLSEEQGEKLLHEVKAALAAADAAGL